MVNIYTPQAECRKVDLWAKILQYMDQNPGNYCIFGDFNSVRCERERFGSVFSNSNATNFNQFIAAGNLIDPPMGGHIFTRVAADGSKGSKLDRVLLTSGFCDMFPNLDVLASDELFSDHRPVICAQKPMDYGPPPFKLFNSWLHEPRFDDVVNQSWNEAVCTSCDLPFFKFRKSLKVVK